MEQGEFLSNLLHAVLLLVLSLLGDGHQVLKIVQGPRNLPRGEHTKALSLPFQAAGFYGYFLSMLYALGMSEVNLWIVIPRVVACLSGTVVIILLWLDRRDWKTALLLLSVVLSSIALPVLLLVSGRGLLQGSTSSTSIALYLGACALLYANASQVYLILKLGTVGRLSGVKQALSLFKNLALVCVTLYFPGDTGRPLAAGGVVVAFFNAVILSLFYWVRVSPLARARRQRNDCKSNVAV